MNNKPQTTLKEIRRKMRKLTLAEKKQIKEEKQQKQQEKREKQKQKISQRVKININVPSSLSTGNLPQHLANREHITVLNSINEQLKKQNEPKPITEQFNIPIKKQENIEPKPLIEQFNIPIKKQEIIEPKIEKPQTYDFNEFEKELQDITSQFENLYKDMPTQFSEKVVTPQPIIREPTIPIITQPEETSSKSLIEKVEKPKVEVQKPSMPTNLIKEIMKKQEKLVPFTEETVSELESKVRRKVGEMSAEEQQLMDKAFIKAERDKAIKENAFNILLEQIRNPEEEKKLRAEFLKGNISEYKIKKGLEQKGFSQEEIKNIFSRKK